MTGRFSKISAFSLFLLCIILHCSKTTTPPKDTTTDYRIISFAPSITEIIYALNLQTKLVGVTTFCNYPSDALNIEKIGGYIDPNYEKIISLHPNRVFLLKEHIPVQRFLDKYEIRYTLIDNESISGILNSISLLADNCGARERGDSLKLSIQNKLFNTQKVFNKKPSVLLCVGRNNQGSGEINKVYIAGPKTFYNELITLSGAVNAYTDSLLTYPQLSLEGIISLQPDIIIDCVMVSEKEITPEGIVNDWRLLKLIPAVKNGNVFALSGDHITIPGPRISIIFDDISRIVEQSKITE
jgi:iron complex transport system substrate-binding protein